MASMRRSRSALGAEPRTPGNPPGAGRWPWLTAACVALLFCAARAPAAEAVGAGEGGTRELQVEAAFLVNFVRYTEWPAFRRGAPGAPWIVSVVGSEGDAAEVAAVAYAAGPINGRRIEVRRVDPDSLSRHETAARRLQASHAVFVRGNSNVRCATVKRLLAGAPVLTVGDATGCAATGGMLGLVRVDRHLAFEANPDEIRAAGLSVSAKVLKLARIRRSAP